MYSNAILEANCVVMCEATSALDIYKFTISKCVYYSYITV